MIYLAFDHPAERDFLILQFLRNFALELGQLFCKVALAVIKGLLDLFDVHFGLNMLGQGLFDGENLLNRAPINNFFLDGVIVESELTHLRLDVFFLLIYDSLHEVCCLINVPLSIIGEMPELLLLSIYLVKGFLTIHFIFFKFLLDFLFF